MSRWFIHDEAGFEDALRLCSNHDSLFYKGIEFAPAFLKVQHISSFRELEDKFSYYIKQMDCEKLRREIMND